MTNLTNIKELARQRARDILSNNITFMNLSIDDQKKMYLDVVNEQIQIIKNEQLSGSKSYASRSFGDKGASEDIDESRHEKGFDGGIDAFEDLVDSVDFPVFVRDLLKSVFDANTSVMKAQTDEYIKLMKEASSGLAKFIKKIDDTTTFAYLAENKSDQFNMSMEKQADGSMKMSLTDPKGNAVDLGDNEVKAKIMDAKIKMAQEHRAALREMILMGITRLVVEKGEIEAEVNFEFKGNRTQSKSDTSTKNTNSKTQELSWKKFRGISYTDEKTTKFSVSTANSTSSDDLKAKLRGFVKIQFKTDYFKLDNFATMYGPPKEEDKKAALTQGNK